MREYNELALNVGRAWQSEQTGFVHHCYHTEPGQKHDCIPVYENLLFVLALLKSRLVENVQEAKLLLNRLLSYQKEGNFPVYLHDYPIMFDWSFGKKNFVVLKEINLFSPVLGQELKALLQKTIEAIGEPVPVEFAYESKILGNYLLAHTSLEALKCWDPRFRTYIGPAICERTEGSYGERSLFDLICSYHQGLPPPVEQNPKRYQLEAVLVKPNSGIVFEDYDIFKGSLVGSQFLAGQPVTDQISENKLDSDQFSIIRRPSYTYTVVSHKKQFRDKRFHPFRLFWGDPSNLYSFVCQNSYAEAMSFSHISDKNGDKIELLFDLPQKEDFDNDHESQEISFYCTRGPGIDVKIENQKATIFRLNDKINIINNRGLDHLFEIDLTFELLNGEGEFIGHLMPGNRPSQKLKDEAYDWQIFLRTLHRKNPCQIKVTIQCKDVLKNAI